MGKVFNFFSGSNNKSGRGVTKKQVRRDKNMGTGFFFRVFKQHFSSVSSTSLIFSVCILPLVVVLVLALSGIFDHSVPAPSSPLYASVYGLELAGVRSPFLAMLSGLFGTQASVSVMSSVSNTLMYVALFLIVLFGVASIGAAYNCRSIVRGEPVSSWSDFFYAIKRNLKQGLPIVILDTVMIIFLAYDLMAYYTSAVVTGSTYILMMFYVILFFSLIYYVLRFHAYLILVTFDLKFSKLVKNALFLVFLGWKRSLVCVIVSALVLYVNLYIYWVLPYFGLLLPFALTFGFLSYLGVYCTYPIIERYMIEPYYRDHPEERPQEEEVEAIFEDRG